MRSFALTVAFVAAFFVTAPANAQMMCGDRSKMVDYLTREYQESRVGVGIEKRGAAVELFASKKGTWTILVTVPAGPTCVIGSGENWVIFPLAAPTSYGTDA